MAGAPSKRQDDGDTSEGPSLVVSLAIAIVIGLLGGGAFGFVMVPAGQAPAVEKPAVEPEPKVEVKPEAAKGRFPNDALEFPLPPIIVALDGDPSPKMRLDLSLITARGTPDSGSLKSEVREDVIAFLQGMKLKDIQGVRGFQNLREQLDDRAKVRGRGVVLGLLISGLVVE